MGTHRALPLRPEDGGNAHDLAPCRFLNLPAAHHSWGEPSSRDKSLKCNPVRMHSETGTVAK